jgi:hypothetical protein
LIIELDPRPPTVNSIVEASTAEDEGQLVSDDVETDDWRAIPAVDGPLDRVIGFVDGVQRTHARVGIRHQPTDWPKTGLVTSVGAGFLIRDKGWRLRSAEVRHRLVIGPSSVGAEAIPIETTGGTYSFEPTPASDDEPLSLHGRLLQLREDLEAQVTRTQFSTFDELIIVDGRLPPAMPANVVGLIKTPARMGLSRPDRLEVIGALCGSERSPLFEWRRSQRVYFRCYVCLRKPRRFEVFGSGLALLEMDHDMSVAEAKRTAGTLCGILPQYANTASRDVRAPQNLMPIARIEQKLSHLLGDSRFIRSRLARIF